MTTTAKRDVIDTYRAEYGPEMGDDWRTILMDMAAMADGQGNNLVRYACIIAMHMETRGEALAVLAAIDGNTGLVRRVLGLA